MKPYRNAEAEFQSSYIKTVEAITDAVLAFEKQTGRTVMAIDWQRIDITSIGHTARQYHRECVLDVAPTPGELNA